MSIRLKSFKAGIAVTITSFVVQFLHVVSSILLARLLEPSDFGIIALANILLGGINLFSSLGLRQALIATKEDKTKAAFHAFLMTAGMGILLSIGMFSFAGVYSNFYDYPQLADVCRWMTIIILFGTLKAVPDALLVKEMLFGRRVLPTIIATLSGITVSLSMAYTGYGVWSIVFGALATALVGMIAIAAVCPEWGWLTTRHKWDTAIAKPLLKFGAKNMSTGVVQYFYNHVDDFIVGKSLGVTMLGFYTQGYRLSNIAVTSVSSVVNSVLLPAYSKISHDDARLASAYLNSFQMVAVITIPLAMGIYILAPEAVIVLVGEKWRQAIPILEIFAFMSLIRPLSGTTSPLFLSRGFPQYNLRTAFIQAGTLALLIFPFLRWGISGIAFAVVLAFVFGFIHNVYLACYKTGIPLKVLDMIKQVLPSLLAGTIMMIVIAGAKSPILNLVDGEHNFISLLCLIFIGMCTYAVSLFIINRRLFLDILDLCKSAAYRRKIT